MKQRSFFTTLFVGNLTLVIVIIALVMIASYHYLNERYQRENEQEQALFMQVLTDHFTRLWPQSLQDIDKQCKEMLIGSTLRMTVIAADGRVLGDSVANPMEMENHKTDDRPEVVNALKGTAGKYTRSSETTNVEYRYFSQPIVKSDIVVGAVRVAMPVQTITHGSNLIRRSLLMAGLLAIVVAVCLAMLLSWVWYSPLKQITAVARKIASGNLSDRVYVPTSSREMAQLVVALDELRANLALRMEQIAGQQQDLQLIIENLGDGVIALDNNDRIVLANNTARTLLATEVGGTNGYQLQEVVRILDAIQIVADAKKTDVPVTEQIDVDTDFGKKTINCTAINVLSPHSATSITTLIVMHDITEQIRVTTIKAEFVASASHELRTPLATIRATVDSLIEAPPENRETLAKLVDILNRHTTRLEDLTKDLLDLHLIETAKTQLQLEQIEPRSLVKWTCEYFTSPADSCFVHLNVTTNSPDIRFTSDRKLIQLIIQNLVENAIKFTPKNGQVNCLFEHNKHELLIRVSDTGCGIPSALHERIFERFFQVDESRTENTGIHRGTGLGLAILKHAAERLNADISIRSEIEKGTTIEMRIPLTETTAGI